MNLHQELKEYLTQISTKFPAVAAENGWYLTFSNSGIRETVKSFTLSTESFLEAFKDIRNNLPVFASAKIYKEDTWRELAELLKDVPARSILNTQTKPTFCTLIKILAWANNDDPQLVNDSLLDLNQARVDRVIEQLTVLLSSYAKADAPRVELKTAGKAIPKPFILLAGISGTGKTRFVKQQADATSNGNSNYMLIPVRPDWHEPSDLLGYVSRIGGTHYVATPFLQFMSAAWRHAAAPNCGYRLKDDQIISPFWACLDEMNLAPVEQYFADYLSILETRKWTPSGYTSAPIFAPGETLRSVETKVIEKLRQDLGFEGAEWEELWNYFVEHGMPIPPNLIVAGTVNMDETTHGFSRKVIDRAFTIDFGNFFPNTFNAYFSPTSQPEILGYPTCSHITGEADLTNVKADPTGKKSIEFLQAVNGLLAGTAFELAYRALNELLLMLAGFAPADEAELHAVWDDFIMAKLLPRLEGDEDKLQSEGESSLLDALRIKIDGHFASTPDRPDLFNRGLKGEILRIPFRSSAKLDWMQQRLARDRFTRFWP